MAQTSMEMEKLEEKLAVFIYRTLFKFGVRDFRAIGFGKWVVDTHFLENDGMRPMGASGVEVGRTKTLGVNHPTQREKEQGYPAWGRKWFEVKQDAQVYLLVEVNEVWERAERRKRSDARIKALLSTLRNALRF